MTDKIIIKNAHCVYFEGQTGLCKAKEFTKCNPVNCKLYTIDELSTILGLQNRNAKLEQECEELKKQLQNPEVAVALTDVRTGEREVWRKLGSKLKNTKKALEEIESLCKNEACAPCKELEENDHCDECHGKIILDIINKTKEENQCEQ